MNKATIEKCRAAIRPLINEQNRNAKIIKLKKRLEEDRLIAKRIREKNPNA